MPDIAQARAEKALPYSKSTDKFVREEINFKIDVARRSYILGWNESLAEPISDAEVQYIVENCDPLLTLEEARYILEAAQTFRVDPKSEVQSVCRWGAYPELGGWECSVHGGFRKGAACVLAIPCEKARVSTEATGSAGESEAASQKAEIEKLREHILANQRQLAYMGSRKYAQENEALKVEIERLRGFARAIMDERYGNLDGGKLQDLGVKHGLLIPTEVTDVCGENCVCEEYGDFPQTCYRFSRILTGEAEHGG